MQRVVIVTFPPLAAAAAGVVFLSLWLGSAPGVELTARLPVERPEPLEAVAEPPVDLKGFHVPGDGSPADLPGAWPRFRGPNFDAVSTETVRLARTFPPGGPPMLWSIDLGEGYAGAAVLNGCVYVLDYDQQAKADTLRCLSLADGREIWRRGYYVRVKRNHGMSRTVPAVTDEHVLTVGPKCHVLCADAQTGQFRWGIDLVAEYGARVPDWYTGQCPLIDEGRAILAVGGEALMIAVDCQTGRVLWQTPNPRGWRMTHSSVMPMTVAGRRMYVYCASGGVVGVAAETGQVLWRTDAWTVNMANVPSPLAVGEGRIFLTGGYGAGSMMVRIVWAGEAFAVEELFRLPPRVFASEQHTPIFYGGYLYGIKENGELVCLDLSGEVVWQSGRTNRFGRIGRGPYLIADGLMFLTDGDRVLWIVEVSPSGFRPLGETKVLTHGESWAPMALAGGRLILRDLTRMVCLDVRAGGHHD